MTGVSRAAGRFGILALALSGSFAQAQIDVTTERYDDARLGANLQETQLTTQNVNTTTFGKLWSYTVNGQVYAQPLYVRNVTIPGQGTHNVLYVVTMNDWVYAFDADSNADTPLLSFDLTTEVPGSRANTILEILGYNDNIIGNVGIESTPHIDLATNTMYLVARTFEEGGCIPPNPGPNATPNPKFCQRLHALDITTLQEKAGSPVILGGAMPLSGGDSLTFDPKISHQRSSLALSNGHVFIAWAGHSDRFDYHGWLMVYDAATLQQTKLWSSAPAGNKFFGGGIWMAGRAPAIDADGNVYYMVGNGPWDGVDNFGESFLKFGTTPDTPLLDWLTPNEVDNLNGGDVDLGGSGPILVPGSDLVIGGGKGGKFYVTHTADMGHLGVGTGNTNIVQAFSNGGQQIKGGPVYWNRTGGAGPWMYVWADNHSTLKAYHFNADYGTGTPAVPAFDTTPASQSLLFSNNGSAGGVMTLSANGSTPGSGIIWSSMAFSGSDANSGIHPGVLRALNADDLNHELWNSEQNSARDSMGNWPKFSPPTVVNGHVYMGSFPSDGVGETQVSVYGLIQDPDFTLTVTPPNPGVNPGGSVTYTITTAAIQNFADPVHLSVSGLPANATATFAANDMAPPSSTTLTVQTDADTPIGANTLTITATSGALTHSADAGLYVTAATPGAGIIGIDFVGNGTPMGALESAGVVAIPNWNEAAAASGSNLALADETGTLTGATASWSADAVWALGIADTPGDFRMMNGYLDATDNASTLTVADLPDDPAGYYVYVYADGDNAGDTRAGEYAISGPGTTAQSIEITDAANATFDGSYMRADNSAGNYAVFFVGGTRFTLTATPGPASSSTVRAPLNAIQIVHGDRIFADGFD
ncbi:MAG: PQQ-binding-like beta-propeller repeat protein [Dokdonella sp.]